ncbi:hypothetical protein AKJ36_00155 [candidate division MSBL1 archaeon SCGC-AAA259I07]|uniref:5-formyltetrahydrofolate cyclo-ligase n=1 Tax=candidate division MSBL1 archaeon SCGC-AAA259I07 TaxID=1698266 RepID=A0A133UN96_9EURY|nr:hypothetical protein AKJ36_00155 [candidate division MSBL1 archaeon SCGC-AAA259I07]
MEKSKIRKRVWSLMEERDVARFPRPVEGRIPNFEGAGKAAERVDELPVYREATHIKVNPDSPQHPLREKVIRDGKILYMPTPRLKEGFLRIKPEDVPSGKEGEATTIKHSSEYGEKVDPEEMEKVSLVVAGSVAVTRDGKRVGKGGGYSDLEYAILREMGLGKPPVLTTVHPTQIMEKIPAEDHDVPLDWILTPGEAIETSTDRGKPDGIDWSLLGEEDLEKIPLLKRMKNRV